METNYTEHTVHSTDGYALDVHVFDVPAPKAVVRFIHGMEEHQERYEPFAAYLQEKGYAVVTADLRGHGKTAPVLCHIADGEGDRLLIEDEETLLGFVHDRWPGRPVCLFAHSMGTIIARKLLQTESRAFTKVVLSGYPNPQSAAKAGILVAGCLSIFKGKQGHSRLVDGMVTGGFGKAVKDAQSPLDWLSVNRENVRKYEEDPLCGVPFTLGSYETLFQLLVDIGRPELYRHVNEELPILLIAGSEDPCVGGAKGRSDSVDRLQRAGFRNLRTENLQGMRHEILNETDHMAVYGKILAFLEG